MISLADIEGARRRIAPIARVTPLVDVSAAAGRPFFLKCENLQPAGAFKIRGAYNMIAQLGGDERRRGVITYSSGNHGQAMALAARELGRRRWWSCPPRRRPSRWTGRGRSAPR